MKLVFFDIDGTLAHGLEVPESTQSAIKQLRKNGHKVLICTGRAISYVKKYFAQYADGYIAFNGRYGEMNGKVLYDHPVSPEKIHEIAQVLREEGAGFAFYNLDHGYFEGMPAPAGACVIVTYVLSGFQFGPVGTAILTLAVAKLMYSEVRYPDFKGHGNPLFKVPVILSFIIGAAMLFSNFSAWPFVIMFTYTICGVLNAIYVKVTGKKAGE